MVQLVFDLHKVLLVAWPLHRKSSFILSALNSAEEHCDKASVWRTAGSVRQAEIGH